MIKEVLQDPTILPENVYNMDETGVMLFMPGSVKVLVSKKRKSATQEPPEPSSKVARATVTASVVQMSGTPIAEDEIVPEPWRAPVARMY